MASVESALDLSLEELAAARLMGLAAILRDVLAAECQVDSYEAGLGAAREEMADGRGDGPPQQRLSIEMLEPLLSRARPEFEERRRDAVERVEEIRSWQAIHDVAPEVRVLTGSQISQDLDILDRCLARLGASQTGERSNWVVLEAWVATSLGGRAKWIDGKVEALEPSVRAYQPMLTEGMVRLLLEQLGTLHKKALKRLSKDAMAPGTQATFGVAALGMALVLPGSDVVGTFIGTHLMGLSGAAATSAGLAALGGGSLASGGFGMAGGAIVAGSMIKGAESVSRRVALAQVIAKTSKGAFISEIASLDVRCALEPSVLEEVLGHLKLIEADLRAEWVASRPQPAVRRGRIWGHLASLKDDPGNFAAILKQAKDELPDSEERNLATCVRALQYEIKHLESPTWKRQASSVPRFFGIPIAAGLIDVAEEQWQSLLEEPPGSARVAR